ncbi:MAG TPA: hypothetical protein VGO02_03330 [Burkholderiales bacterium]|jgi:hypothetical protein|nr:hypothetical protein [Burkholderiales bacterium]
MLGWFNTKELDEFADSLVAELLERVPPAGRQLSGAKALQRISRSFGATFTRIDAFARSQRLNVYKKAHFANRIRWALKEAGYPEDFCATMTQELLMHLSPPPREKGK